MPASMHLGESLDMRRGRHPHISRRYGRANRGYESAFSLSRRGDDRALSRCIRGRPAAYVAVAAPNVLDAEALSASVIAPGRRC